MKKTKKDKDRLEIAEGIYDPEESGQGGIVETIDLQSGNQSENCWIFPAPKKFNGKRVRLYMEIVRED